MSPKNDALVDEITMVRQVYPSAMPTKRRRIAAGHPADAAIRNAL
ncbi:hypothetical protein [Stieleria tagensis]|nr:hypothetical protein [Stieleria tagensis]